MSDTYFCVFWAEKDAERKALSAKPESNSASTFRLRAPSRSVRVAKISALSPAKR